MSQQERTTEGEKRWHETRERAKVKAKKFFDRIVGNLNVGTLVLDEDELVKMLTGFALDERKREEGNKHPPDVVAQEFKAQETRLGQANTNDCRCFEKARAKGEPTFTLRAQDVSAPWVVFEWVRRNWHHCPVEKLADALAIAQTMERWVNKKAAD